MTQNAVRKNVVGQTVFEWVDAFAKVMKPNEIKWCDGSDQEFRSLVEAMVKDGTLIKLNAETYPNCYLHRSDPNDVSRSEEATFICTENVASSLLETSLGSLLCR